ncbi:N-alpha-acetyltransferase 80-like [Portunus trituberculatus]|uniref:N-acetyltransferase 6 n=1 Tax=Portunus trituberculatus TaxID=210409 RepID=A0A5B7DRL4_PORTR|nr:N-alpha-acetyltransferase 80-like [Portunus trituberculatus]XP_045111875.1 N-alpha-acetyltransferase 80-like [Portunus trituberculatus]XP_045111876.1 N-alpha-acetyltransferase 80-like [Portunus trituberculatus]MPC23777.1 N-acetyltransferase 6 [Portunus trituberculatus]
MKGEEGLRLVTLHSHPEHTEECMKILNDQWPRSRTMRMRSLSTSCDQFPTSLLLLKTTSQGDTEVIGHSRLNTLPREPDAAWIESVVIRRDLRGAGYGRQLMTRTEEYARVSGFTTMYLSTHDQQVFYGKLGYEFCPPVCIYGGSVNKHLIPKHFIPPQLTQGVQALSLKNSVVKDQKQGAPPPATPAPPHPSLPRPPPLPTSSKLTKDHITKMEPSTLTKMYMTKEL